MLLPYLLAYLGVKYTDTGSMLAPYLTINSAGQTYLPQTVYTQQGIDSVLGYTPYNSTNPNGYISSESDPVALNTNITLNQSRGVLINGAASQKLGAPPVWTIGADTTVVEPVSDVVKYLRMQDTRTANPAKLPSGTGAGTRFEWIPNLAAIRASSVTGNKWDSANIGPYSTAFQY